MTLGRRLRSHRPYRHSAALKARRGGSHSGFPSGIDTRNHQGSSERLKRVPLTAFLSPRTIQVSYVPLSVGGRSERQSHFQSKLVESLINCPQ